MKKSFFKVTAALVLSLSLLLVGNPVKAAEYSGNVTFVVDGRESVANFQNDAVINAVKPISETDLNFFNPRASRVFLYYTTTQDKNDPNAKYVMETQKISEVYPDGIPADAKLYAHYAGVGEVAALLNAKNALYINKDRHANAILTDQEVVLNEVMGLDNEDSSTGDVKKIEAVYMPDHEKYGLHLDSSFAFNKDLAVLTYRNPNVLGYIVGGPGDQINTVASDTSENANYVYVDLKVNLDEKVTPKDEISMTFKSYNFFPWMVLTEDYQKLETTNMNGEVLDNLDSVSNDTSPLSTFKFKTNGNKKFILRTRIRANANNNKKISNVTMNELMEDIRMISDDVENFAILNADAKENADANENGIAVINVSGKITGKVHFNSLLRIGSRNIPTVEQEKSLAIKFINKPAILNAVFVDENGEELQTPWVFIPEDKGYAGQPYDITGNQPEKIEANGKTYVFVKVGEDTPTKGKLKEGVNTVTFVYKEEVKQDEPKEPEVNPVQPEKPEKPEVEPTKPEVKPGKDKTPVKEVKPNQKPNVNTNDTTLFMLGLLLLSGFVFIFNKKTK